MDQAPKTPATGVSGADSRPAASVGAKMAKGAAWMVSMRWAIRGLGILSTIVLARLLLPVDFGLIALAAMLVEMIEVMGRFSFDVVLIQNQKAGRQDYDSAWTMSVIRNASVAVVLVLSAALASDFFAEPRLESVLYCLALATLVDGFANVGIVDFRKHFEFHKDFMMMVATKLGMVAVALPLAFVLRNYWAMVAGILAASFTQVALSYAMHPYRPRLSLSKSREIFGFSKWLMLSNIIQFFFNKADAIVIGKLGGPQSLGLYSIAHEIANLPTTEVVAPIRRAIYPGYARLAAVPDQLRSSFVNTLAIIVMIGAPIAAGIGLIADPLVHTLLGSKWAASVPIIQVLTAYGLLNVCSANTWPVYLALRRPELFTAIMGVGLLALVPLLIWCASVAGAYGAAWAVTAAAGLLLAINTTFISRVLDLKVIRLMAAIWRTLVATIAMAIVIVGIQVLWPAIETVSQGVVLLTTVVVIGAIAYAGAHIGIWILCGSPDGAERHALAAVQRRFPKLNAYIPC